MIRQHVKRRHAPTWHARAVRFVPPPGWVDKRGLHGTATGYQYGCRCGDCRGAHAAANRLARARRARALPETTAQLVHGTRSTYVNHGCRCSACDEAQRRANAGRVRRRP